MAVIGSGGSLLRWRSPALYNTKTMPRNPNRPRMRREVICDCGNKAELVNAVQLYGKSAVGTGYEFKMFWRCRPCRAYVGTHSNSPDFKPLGKLANASTRAARTRAHCAFDSLWKGTRAVCGRGHAYRRLALHLGMTKDECHIGEMGADDCARVVSAVPVLRAELEDENAARARFDVPAREPLDE